MEETLSSEQEEKPLLIKRKKPQCIDFLAFVALELSAILLCIVLGTLWVLLCLGTFKLPDSFLVLVSYKQITISLFICLDFIPIALLTIQMYQKWEKLNKQITVVDNVEIFNQPSKKKLAIKRNKKIGNPNPGSSSSYFSIGELPGAPAFPGLRELVKKIDDPNHVPVPFLKWKQGCEAEYLLKVTLIGDIGTGKTSFREAVSGNPFSKQYRRTFGIDFSALYWEYEEEERLSRFHITIWDTDGHYETGSHFKVSGKSANCVSLIYNITKPDTLHLLRSLYAQITSISLGKDWPYPPKFVVLANMTDKDKDWKKENDTKWIHANLNCYVPVVPISCATGFGIARAAEVIVLTACGLIGGGDPD